MDTQAFKKDIRIWVKRISHNSNTLPELLWKEGEQSNQLMIRKQNKEDLELDTKFQEPLRRCSVMKKMTAHHSKWIKHMITSARGIR